MARLTEILTEAIGTAREVTQDTAPLITLKRELAEGFRWIVRDAKKRHQLEVESRVQIGDALKNAPEAIAVLLFTAARELLLNVVKHAGTSQATLRLLRQEDAVVLEVADEGRGFAPSVVDETQEHGFGLMSIRERVELLGGHFELDSSPGSGVRVRVTVPLPAVSPPTHVDTLPKVPLSPGRETARRGPRKAPPEAVRIVFVDDHHIVRESLASLLSTYEGINVVGQADNGQEAVELVGRVQPDVVVMDVSMPTMDGVQATQIIKHRWPSIKVIGLSMFDEAEHGIRIRAAGADDYIAKSEPPEQLIEAIYTCMDMPRAQTA
jgi:CheY-like chemotaxis protein/anti-sigma regulatory factor (Ser/Thr protein kinase)